MSFASTLSSGFKNFGHAIATGAKYLAIGVKDVVLAANKAQSVQPEVDLLVGALAGPLGVKISDTAFHLLGDVATALSVSTVGTDAAAVSTSTGVNLTLDATLAADIKALIPVITAILKSVGATVPAPAAK